MGTVTPTMIAVLSLSVNEKKERKKVVSNAAISSSIINCQYSILSCKHLHPFLSHLLRAILRFARHGERGWYIRLVYLRLVDAETNVSSLKNLEKMGDFLSAHQSEWENCSWCR